MPSLIRSLCASLAACLSLGCMAQYQAPTAQQPHAIVKFRRSYLKTPGTTLSEIAAIDGTWAFKKQDAPSLAQVARTDAFLVHPKASEVTLGSSFSHQESRRRQESYSCGSSQNPRTCYRTVTRSVTVSDGSCEETLGIVFKAGRNYLLQFNYQESGNCSASCYMQVKQSEGKFKNYACQTFVPQED